MSPILNTLIIELFYPIVHLHKLLHCLPQKSKDFASKGYPFKNIFDFTTAGDWDCVGAVEPLPALHKSVDFIFLSFEIMGFIVEL